MVGASGCTCQPANSEPSYAIVNLRFRITICSESSTPTATSNGLCKTFTNFYPPGRELRTKSVNPSDILRNFPWNPQVFVLCGDAEPVEPSLRTLRISLWESGVPVSQAALITSSCTQ